VTAESKKSAFYMGRGATSKTQSYTNRRLNPLMNSAGSTAGAGRPLHKLLLPSQLSRVPFAPLAELPTPVESLSRLTRALGRPSDCAFIKRDDLSSPIYGGNKVRTLEVLFGTALAEGATHIFSTGSFGSNHATATVLHAPRVGLKPGVMLFPQPESKAALDNLEVVLSQHPRTYVLPHWSALPFGMWLLRGMLRRRRERSMIMVPGGATPWGALGYVSAGLELAEQVAAGLLPPPSEIILGVGSTCTSAGLLVGLDLAARLGLAFRGSRREAAIPRIVAVRVTPWPATSSFRIVALAVRTSKLLAVLTGDRSLAGRFWEFSRRLEVDRRFFGRGYGYPTKTGLEAIELFRRHVGIELDTTYSAKSAAALIERVRRGAEGPLLFWSTKSTVPLPIVEPANLEWAPDRMRKWMDRARSA